MRASVRQGAPSSGRGRRCTEQKARPFVPLNILRATRAVRGSPDAATSCTPRSTRGCFRRNHATDNPVVEQITFAASCRADANPAVSKLSAPRGLLLVPALPLGTRGDCFTKCDAWLEKLGLYTELALEHSHRHFELSFAKPANNCFARFTVVVHFKGWIFVVQTVQSELQFSSSPRAVGFTAKGTSGSASASPRKSSDPGVLMKLILLSIHSAFAHPNEMEYPRSISSGRWSVSAVPLRMVPCRWLERAAKQSASTRLVLPREQGADLGERQLT